jgi:hypothetical protein
VTKIWRQLPPTTVTQPLHVSSLRLRVSGFVVKSIANFMSWLLLNIEARSSRGLLAARGIERRKATGMGTKATVLVWHCVSIPGPVQICACLAQATTEWAPGVLAAAI